MSVELPSTLAEPRPSFLELFTPKLVTILREGYGLAGLRADVVAGLTVAIVALPLSMAIAIASGATPERGLYAAIVGGFLVSAAGRQPVPDRRAGRRLHLGAGRRVGRPSRHRRRAARHGRWPA